MSKRENLVWQLVCIISVLLIGVISYNLYKKYANLNEELNYYNMIPTQDPKQVYNII